MTTNELHANFMQETNKWHKQEAYVVFKVKHIFDGKGNMEKVESTYKHNFFADEYVEWLEQRLLDKEEDHGKRQHDIRCHDVSIW